MGLQRIADELERIAASLADNPPLYLYRFYVNTGMDRPIYKCLLSPEKLTPREANGIFERIAKRRRYYDVYGGHYMGFGPASAYDISTSVKLMAVRKPVATGDIWYQIDFKQFQKA